MTPNTWKKDAPIPHPMYRCTACAGAKRPSQQVCDSCRCAFIADAGVRADMLAIGVVPD